MEPSLLSEIFLVKESASVPQLPVADSKGAGCFFFSHFCSWDVPLFSVFTFFHFIFGELPVHVSNVSSN
jgi:hypothetical protein